MPQKQYKVNDFVFVLPIRGKTPGIARVTEITPYNEAKIVYDNGEKDEYYFVHLYQTTECIKRCSQYMIDRANKVGKK
mgnify:CR=1 FL=1